MTRPLGRRLATTFAIFGPLALAAIVLTPVIGSTPISLRRAFDFNIPFADNVDAQIFFIARLPRTLAGALVGAMLASAGVVFQGLLPAAPAASFAGSLIAVGVVYALARARHSGLSTNVLLLAGVTMNAFFSALILFVQYFADFAETYRILRWLMGDLDISSYQPLLTALPLVVVSFAVFAWLARPLNLLNLGAESAGTHGLDVTRAQRAAFLSASLATGAAVSVGGPVGFIGIIVPHLVRLLVGSDHRVVLPASALFGAAFLIGCDLVARTAMAPIELPVGVITAIIGGPFFLWLLVRRRF